MCIHKEEAVEFCRERARVLLPVPVLVVVTPSVEMALLLVLPDSFLNP
jgi:hypothetical protein